ncbi:MAG: oligopeptide transporter, OPT family [Gemmataceae bacterium]|nr:oligopeptide transporter, OPT family [Gemmataceae bacterium]
MSDPNTAFQSASMPTPSAPISEDHPPDFKPYVPDEARMPEFTWPAVLAGSLLGLVFGASSLYLVLKVGMTVSASIPVAVLSITLFRWLSAAFGLRKTTILENNIVQTAGSAGESIAFGVGVTMPALMLIGFEMHWSRVLVVSVLGGLLGILMMIPLRRAFIVKLHGKAGEPGKLLYPEGTACAQVLISGDKGGSSGSTVFIGFGLAFAHKFVTEGLNVLATTATLPLKLGASATDAFSRIAKFTGDMASELLGVGYIIGLRTAAIMMAGAVLGGFVLAPTIAISGDPGLTTGDIYKNYLRYIGAGCVAAAGIISMSRTLPMIVRSFSSGLGAIRGKRDGERVRATPRTEDDLPPAFVFGGNLFLLVALTAFLHTEVGIAKALLGSLLVLAFGFLFVTVSSRLTGEIGSSSNPISGMTVATLLMTCLIFLSMGMTSPLEAVLALSIGGVVCIAASNGGTTSQDLKTGFLVGATPKWQQWAILIGAGTSAVVIGGTLLLFNSVGNVYSQRDLPQIVMRGGAENFTEMEAFEGESFYVIRPSKEESYPSSDDPTKAVKLKPGKYLVNSVGELVALVDPTITGELKSRDELQSVQEKVEPLTKDEIASIKHTFTVPSGFGKRATVYKLWRNGAVEGPEEHAKGKEKAENQPIRKDLPAGEYLVNSETGAIEKKIEQRPVSMKFNAPKTQVMGIIINGLLNQNLNWSLVLIGACIAVALELCGVSSLAFAVGLYIPMQYSTPIFLGGVVRWGVDSLTSARARAAAVAEGLSKEEAEVRAIAESESSPGMLLSSGFIAGGSLAGVLIAFLNFMPESWQTALSSFGRFVELDVESPSVGHQIVALLIFLSLAALLWLVGVGKLFAGKKDERA